MKNKRGSYIVEAAMLLPFLFIAVMMLASLLPAISVCENSIYVACDELRQSSIRTAMLKYDVAFKLKVKQRIIEENESINSFSIKRFSQGVRRFGTDDLMLFNYDISVKTCNPVGFAEQVGFNGKIMSRAFTGAKFNGTPMTEEEFLKNAESEKVYIFPKSGKKYHKEECKYVRPACKSMCLTNKIKKRWKTCDLCKSETISVGSMVFCFFNSGKVYHSGECTTVKKYYMEMERFFAEKRGMNHVKHALDEMEKYMGKIIRMVYSENTISGYKMKVLSDNECKIFLPVTFAHLDEHTVGLFSAEGYVNVTKEAVIETTDALDIFSDALFRMKEAMNRFIFPEDYIINAENIFTDSEHKCFRCVFIPTESVKKDLLYSDSFKGMSAFEQHYISDLESIYPNLKNIAEILCDCADDKTCRYIEKALDIVRNCRYGIDYAVQSIVNLKKECYSLGIDRNISLRNMR